MTTWSQALGKLVFWIILLPFLATFAHLIHAQRRSHLLFIGPDPSSSSGRSSNIKITEPSVYELFGMYHGISSNPKNSNTSNEQFRKVMTLPKWHSHWPSIAHVSTVLATPTSILLRRGSEMNDDVYPGQVVYDSKQQRWCAQSSSHRVCSSVRTTSEHDERTSEPPTSGIWTSEDGSRSVDVLYRDASFRLSKPVSVKEAAQQDANMPAKFRRNPNKPTRANRNLQQVLDRPTTSLLIAFNVLVALYYWSAGTNPSSVSKVYNRIVNDGEFWRAFTGATAHFDMLHIGFNMMSLYSLGTELEPSYGSIPFLFYNISLIPITTCIMMAIVYLQIKISGNTALGDTSTVGYSGVLFCWMVIASLERQETCPILFLPELCFKTYYIWKFRFNVSPIVQLFVAQAIMKRVSFVGHLAGIVAGFLLHWNMLPLEPVQPEVLIPGLYLILLWRARKVLPVKPQRNSDDDGDGDDGCDGDEEWNRQQERSTIPSSSGGRFDGLRIKRAKDQAVHQILVRVRTALIVVLVLSAMAFDVLGGMFLAPLIGLVLYQCCIQSHELLLRISSRDSTTFDSERERLGTLWKAFILSSVLTIVCDSMSLGGWIMSSIYWQTENGTAIGLVPACVLMAVRLTVQLVALVVSCKNLSDIGETGGGLFVTIFGSTVLENARVIGTALSSRITRSSWTAFEGQGISLGTSGASEASSSHVV